MNSIEKALSLARETKALKIGSGVISEVASLFKEQFPDKTAVIVADTNTWPVAGEQVENLLQQAGVKQLPPFIFTDPHLYAEYKFVEELTAFLNQADAIPIAVGSGTINDLVKLSSHQTTRPYLCVATAASMDGYTAYGASITYQGAKQTFNCPAPQAVLADIEIIRRAPSQMTAAGYADLLAKVTAGADWILADALGVEPIDKEAWNIVQGGLKDALAYPAEAAKGDQQAIEALTQGLILGGFAMQWAKTSRPASGAEHQFSHLWDMEHHSHNGQSPSHGFKVAIGTLAVTRLYEWFLNQPIEELDVAACCAAWPSKQAVKERAEKMFADTDFPTIGETETLAKYIASEQLSQQVDRLKNSWPEIVQQLRQQLIPADEIVLRLKQVGAPVSPEEIGISRARLRDSFIRAQYIRRRFTVLDAVLRANLLPASLEALFGRDGIWPENH